MSLKSFDKFCEKLILTEPSSQKAVYDERQNVIRSRLAIEALLIFAGLILINSIVMEQFYQWSGSWAAAALLFMTVCMLWWTVRCAVKGCLVPASGKDVQKYSATTTVFIGVSNLIRCVFNIENTEFFFKDGRLSEDLLFTLSFVILSVSGILILCAVIKDNKKNKEE